MDGQCAKCSAKLTPEWKFCPSCGATVVQTTHVEVQHLPAEKTPVKGAFGGLLLGVLVTPMMLIVGTMLCLTGLGAFVGVPMIIGGVLAPLVGPMMGFGSLRGKCPWCGKTVSSISSIQSFDCDACHHRIAFRQNEFVRAA